MHRTPTTVGAVAATAIVSLALAGCATGSAAEPGAGDGLQVVSTTTQLGDLTREVAGDDAQVTQLLQPGQSAHGFDPSPQALQGLAAADVLVINGAGLEEWLDSAVEASGFDGTIVDTSEDVHLHEGAGHDHGDHAHEGEEAHEEHAHEDEAHAEDEHADETHADEADADAAASEDGHDNEHAIDPHTWSDPQNAIHMVESIVAGLSAADEASADAFAANGEAYVGQLEALDAWIHASVEQVPAEERLLVTTHDTFSYLAEAQGIEVVGNVMASLDDNAEPSAAEMDALIAAIRDTGVRAVFSETSINPALAETIARDAGVEVYSGEDALYADSLGAEGSAGATYIGSQIHNITRIVESWGAEPAALPAELEEP